MARPMVRVGTAFLLCSFAASYLSRDGVLILAAGLAAGLLAAAFLPRRFRARVFVCLGAALAACAGFLAYRSQRVFLEAVRPGTGLSLHGTVEESIPSGRGTRVTVWVDGSGIGGAPARFRIYAYVYEELEASRGDAIELTGEAAEVSGTPSFDYARYLKGLGVELVVFAEQVRVTPASVRPAGYYVDALRRELTERIDRFLDGREAGLARAILLGDTEEIDPILENQFERAGITHLFVVSGLHVSLTAGCLLKLLRRLRCPQRTAFLLSMGAAWFFAALTGFGLPAVRACVMLTVLLAGRLFRRPSDALNSLFLAGVGMVLADPAAVMSASFQLSFLATLGAVTLASPCGARIARFLRLKGHAARSACATVGMTLACNLTMFPALVLLFGGVSLAAPLSNLIAVPLLPALLLLTAGMLAVSFCPAAAIPAGLLKLGFGVVEGSASVLAGPPFAYLGLDLPGITEWLFLGGGLLLLAFLLRRRVPRCWPAAIGAVCGSLAVLLTAGMLTRMNTVELLPVSGYDGGMLLICRGTHASVILMEDDAALGEQAESILRSRNVWFVDEVVLLSGDTREPSGVRFLSECMPVGRLVLSAGDPFHAYTDTLCLSDGATALASGEGIVLRPDSGSALCAEATDAGLQVSLEAGGQRVFVTNSRTAALEAECAVLVFGGKNYEMFTHPCAGCVILMNEPKDPPRTFPPGVRAACREQISLRL